MRKTRGRKRNKNIVVGEHSSYSISGLENDLKKGAYKRDSHHPYEKLLDFSPKQLFGRDIELEILRRIIQEATVTTNRQRRIVWVHGRSGSGKTALCRTAFSRLHQQETDNDVSETSVLVIEGKFEQFVESTSVPYSAIADAFDKLGASLEESQKEAMKDCLKYEGNILTKLIPSFSVYDVDMEQESSRSLWLDDNGDSSFMYASERLAIAFRSFLRNFTVRVRPLLIFLDDLQWADRYSKELIGSIFQDEELKNLILVGAFREENLEPIQPFLDTVVASLDDNTANNVVTDMTVHDLDLNAVNSFLASVLSHSTEKMQPLAELIHRKTAGNPYFVVQLLKQLHAQKILSYNFASLKWEWDVESAIAGTNVSDNVVGVISARIQRVPGRVRRILKLAACLGFVVDIDLLRKLDLGLGNSELFSVDSEDTQASGQPSGQQSFRRWSDPMLANSASDDHGTTRESYRTQVFEDSIKCAEQEGFVECTGPMLKFSHDLIHQGFYDMIGEVGSRDTLHYEIGHYLKKNHDDDGPEKSCDESNRLLFLAVDQLNRGSKLVVTDEERLSLIRLNYEACQAAKQQAGIEVISYFLRKAIEHVQPSFWLYYYDLILEVFNSSAEVDFSLGMLEEANATIATIMEHTVRDVDKVRAMVVQFQMYGVQCEYSEAIAHGRRVLKLLGELVPKKVTLFHIVREYYKARREAKNKPDEFFTSMTSTESTNVKTILRILQVGSVYGWNGDVNFAGFAMLRGFRISLREGASDSTPYLYCGYGFMLGLFGKYDEAFRFGQLAQNTRKGKETFPSAINLNYMILSHLQLPVGIALEPLLTAYRVGLETGDLFYGSICLACYVLVYWHSGLPLGTFACDMRNFGEQLSICHQELQLAWLLSAHQFALNLMGESDDPLDFSREAIMRHHKGLFSDNLLQGLGDESRRTVNADILFTLYLQLYNAYILEDVATMANTMKRLRKLKPMSRRFGGTHATNYFLSFIDGLVGLFLSKMNPKSKTGPRVTRSAIAELTNMSKTRPVNSITPLKLLMAEVSARKKSTSTEKARTQYNEAINEFSRSGLNHFCAIANELAGKNMLERQNNDQAEFYLENAFRKWHEYDARVKVQLLVETYSFLEPIVEELSRDASQVYSIQGRARFNAVTDSLPHSADDGNSHIVARVSTGS